MTEKELVKRTLEEAKDMLEEIRNEWLYHTEKGSPVVEIMVDGVISRIDHAIDILE